MRCQFRSVAGVVLSGLLAMATNAAAVTVNYSGSVSGQTNPSPFVIAGTFAPSFDVATYTFAYGDPAGNLHSNAYAEAVADGVFSPIGSGTSAGPDGTFSGSGTTDAPVGTRLWLFAFDSASTDAFFQVLATSSLPNWFVGTSDTTILTSQANQFRLGTDDGDSIRVSVIPFPEPASAVIALGVSCVTLRRSRRMPA